MSNDTPRAVFVTQHFPPDKSGNAARVSDMTAHLASDGWDVTVLAPPPAFPHGQFDRSWRRARTERTDAGVTVHRLWAHQPVTEDPSFLSRIAYYLTFPIHALLWLLVDADEFDAVVTSSPPIFTGLAGLPFGLFTSTPWVVDVRDLWIDASVGLGFIAEGDVLERVSRAYQRLVLSTADSIGITTGELGETLVDHYGIDEEKLLHLPNGVDTDRMQPSARSASQTLVYTGNVGHAQALDACVEAMDRLDATDATLQIVGDGDVRSELETFAEECGVDDRVEFTGLVPRDKIPEILDTAAVGLAPLRETDTLEYAVPTKAYEYMNAGLPVVATGAGEIERLIEASGGGVVVDEEPAALATAFERLLADPDERAHLGEQGRSHMVEHYDRASIARRLGDRLRALVAR